MYEHDRIFSGYGVYEGVGATTAGLTTGGGTPVYMTAIPQASSSALPGLLKNVPVRARKPLLLRLAVRGRTQQVAAGGKAGQVVSSKMFGLAPSGAAAGVATIGFEERAGIWVVSEQAQPVLTEMLKAMIYTDDAGTPVQGPDMPAPDPITGQANFMLGQLVGNAQGALQEKVDKGYAVLLQKASVSTGVLKFLSTKSPETILASAVGPSAPYALVEAPEALELAATNLVVNGSMGPPQGGKIPIDGGAAAPAQASAALPKWVLPVGIGIGVLAIGAIILSARRK